MDRVRVLYPPLHFTGVFGGTTGTFAKQKRGVFLSCITEPVN